MIGRENTRPCEICGAPIADVYMARRGHRQKHHPEHAAGGGAGR